MTGTEQDPIVFMERLRKQIDELTREQIDALKRATYGGMTPDDELGSQFDWGKQTCWLAVRFGNGCHTTA